MMSWLHSIFQERLSYGGFQTCYRPKALTEYAGDIVVVRVKFNHLQQHQQIHICIFYCTGSNLLGIELYGGCVMREGCNALQVHCRTFAEYI